jgi:Tfp pilus assembly protein PilV
MFSRLKSQENQKGLTLIEQVMTLFVAGVVILSWLNLFRVVSKGTIKSKSTVRAQNLAMSKLEDMKTLANSMSMASAWSNVTLNAMAQAYAVTQTSTFDNRNFVWRVTSAYVYVTGTATGSTVTPVSVSYVAANVMFQSEVSWTERDGSYGLTMTGYAANLR